MPIEFQDLGDESVHDDFQRWRASHATGFFINVKSPANLMLHRSDCSHPGDSDWTLDSAGSWGSLTRSKKVCSSDRNVLVRWAAECAPSTTLLKCQTCNPDG